MGSYALAVFGSIIYITLSESYASLIPVMILGTKFGIASSFNIVYLANGLFPPLYSSTTFGLCNCFARLASMAAPQFAEFPKPYPMVIFCIMAAIGGVVTFGIRTNDPKDTESKSARGSIVEYTKDDKN